MDSNDAVKRVKVINKGEVGTTTGRIALRLEEYIDQYHPDIIVTMMGINDNMEQVDPWYLYGNLRLVHFVRTFYRLSRAVILKWFPLLLDNTTSEQLSTAQIASLHSMSAEELIEYVDHIDSLNAHRRALKALEIGAERFSENADILAYLGTIQRWVGQREESRTNLLKALELRPGHEQALKGLEDESFQLGKRMIEIERDSLSGYLVLAELYLRESNYEEAEDILKKGLHHLPGNDKLWGALGTVELNRNERQLAEEYFLRARKIRERSSNPYTGKNYRLIEEKALKHGIPIVALQYPLRDVDEIKDHFLYPEQVNFVSNEEVFKDAVANGGYVTYFIDIFGGEFGHCTPKGNRLIAQNVKTVLDELILTRFTRNNSH
ncbi:MAG: hypothetical protein JW938_01615 [Candidatus Omnitrophica bacterium]|nr:hypothetical protein [Candidatus Omnitrophota bacterium]